MRAASNIENLSLHFLSVLIGLPIKPHRIVCMQNVAYMLASVGNGKRLAHGTFGMAPLLVEGLLAKPANPALVKKGKLPPSINRGMAKDNSF